MKQLWCNIITLLQMFGEKNDLCMWCLQIHPTQWTPVTEKIKMVQTRWSAYRNRHCCTTNIWTELTELTNYGHIIINWSQESFTCIFYFLLETSIDNSFVLQKTYSKTPFKALKPYRLALAERLIRDRQRYGLPQDVQDMALMKSLPPRKRKRISDWDTLSY